MNQILTFIGKFENDVPFDHSTILHGYFLRLGGLQLTVFLMPDLYGIGPISIRQLPDGELTVLCRLGKERVLHHEGVCGHPGMDRTLADMWTRLLKKPIPGFFADIRHRKVEG